VALHLLRESGPRLLIVGVNVADDGLPLAFLERVRAEPRWAALPVVVLSERYRPALAARLDALRVSDLLLKPHLSVDQLLRRVRYYAAAPAPAGTVPLAVAARLGELDSGRADWGGGPAGN
jgi:DNA-binding NarL/FixJ family response regulator